jgi:hypothetical protein
MISPWWFLIVPFIMFFWLPWYILHQRPRELRQHKLNREQLESRMYDLILKAKAELPAEGDTYVDKRWGENRLTIVKISPTGSHVRYRKKGLVKEMKVMDLTHNWTKVTSTPVQSSPPVDPDPQTDSSGSTQESCSEDETTS